MNHGGKQMPTNQQNIRSGSKGGTSPNQEERDRKAMSEAERGQQGKSGPGRDQDNTNQGRSDNTRSSGDRRQG
jgi:hypothetical protein